MFRDFEVNLDNDHDPLRELTRGGRGSDHLLLTKSSAFKITGVFRLFPRPKETVTLGDLTYPFVHEAAADAVPLANGRFSYKTPDLREDIGEVKLSGNHYMLDWDPEHQPSTRPGPHFKVFP
jgi:hypothetical protein